MNSQPKQKPDLPSMYLEALGDYVSMHGFERKGHTFFRGAGMSSTARRQLEEMGAIEKIGYIRDMEIAGIDVPPLFRGKGPTVFYRVATG